jgi:hypothetical protein
MEKMMRPEQLYQELKALADKMNLRVLEQNFRTTGIRVKSGYCKVKGQDHCIVDKHLKLNQKVEVVAECLSEMPLESIYIMPAVREYLDQFRGAATPRQKREEEAEHIQNHADQDKENKASG